MKGYHLDGNKEMVSLGFMNIIGCFTSCYVATGKFDGDRIFMNSTSSFFIYLIISRMINKYFNF